MKEIINTHTHEKMISFLRWLCMSLFFPPGTKLAKGGFDHPERGETGSWFQLHGALEAFALFIF